MQLVVTRPDPDAQTWVQAIQAADHQALALPLMDIRLVANIRPIVRAWGRWSEWQAVMFVSAQAVRNFFKCQPSDITVSNGPRCWSTGPGTYEALRQVGVPAARIDTPAGDAAQFDSETLWQSVSMQVQTGQSVLIVRGHDASENVSTGRDWLTHQLQVAGVSVRFVAAYERRIPIWTPVQEAQARQAAEDGSVWCLSSSKAIAHLTHLLPEQQWSKARCIATHARIAQTAQALGFQEVQISRPSVLDVLRSLESLT